MSPATTENSGSRKDEILDAARACFARYGYEGATVRRLEEATGKSRGAIFHHFRDKEQLFLQLAQQDAAHIAEITRKEGLVEVMREMLKHPERFDWLSTRLEITRLVRSEPKFRDGWSKYQAILDSAMRDRLQANAAAGRMRSDVDLNVLVVYLSMCMEGFISKLAAGGSTRELESVLDLIEETIRTPHATIE